MFDLSMLKGAASRGAGKKPGAPFPPKAPGGAAKPEGGAVIEVAFGGGSKKPQGEGKVESMIAECAKKHGLSPEQLAADFAEFEAQKYGNESPEQEAAEDEGEPAPEAA